MKSRKYPILWELKSKIKERNASYAKLSKEMGLSIDAINNKLNGYSSFNPNEIEFLTQYLQINPMEIQRFFLPSTLRNAT